MAANNFSQFSTSRNGFCEPPPELAIIPLGVTDGIDRAPALLLVRSEEEFLLEGAELGRLIGQAMDLEAWADEETLR